MKALVLRRLEYLRVLRVWSEQKELGLTQAIITIFTAFFFEMKESLKTKVNFEALKGTWTFEFPFFAPKALMHSFKARRLLLISAPSSLLILLLLWVSCPLSLPARSTSMSCPSLHPLLAYEYTLIWHIAWDLLLSSFACVAWVTLTEFPYSMISCIYCLLWISTVFRPAIYIF